MPIYPRPDATFPAIAENGGRAAMSATEIGLGWSTSSQTRPPADKFNERDFLTSSGLKYLCRLGIAEYSPDEEYQGRGMCIGSNGSVYWNLSPCRGIDPVGDTSGHWEKTGVRAADAIELLLGQDVTAGFLTMEQARAIFVSAEWWNNPEGGGDNGNRIWQELHNHWNNIYDLQLWRGDYVNPRLQWLTDRSNDIWNWRDNQFQPAWEDYYWWRNNVVNPQIGDLYGQVNNVWYAGNGLNNAQARIDQIAPIVEGSPARGSCSIGLDTAGGGLMVQWRNDYSQDYTNSFIERWLEFHRPFPRSCWNVALTSHRFGGQNNQIMSYVVAPSGWSNNGVNVQLLNRGDMAMTTMKPSIIAIGN